LTVFPDFPEKPRIFKVDEMVRASVLDRKKVGFDSLIESEQNTLEIGIRSSLASLMWWCEVQAFKFA